MANENLTIPRIDKAKCPADKQQFFLWDKKVPGLGVRITKTTKVYIFQGRHGGKTIRFKIDSVAKIILGSAKGGEKGPTARKKALDIASQLAKGIDPREEKKRVVAAETALHEEASRQEVIVHEAWKAYLKDRKPHWSDRHYQDHTRLSHAGGADRKRSKSQTIPGALSSLMPLKLAELTPDTVKQWIEKESANRGTQTALGYRLLRAFINWCETQKQYKNLASPDACSTRIAKDNLPKQQAKRDCLQKEQLIPFFEAVRSYTSRTPLQSDKIIAAYIQVLLLTGRRPNEILSLRWGDIDFIWNTITIHDKVDGKADIPLTPYVASLLSPLPRKNQWVFSSPRSSDGKLHRPSRAFTKILNRANIQGLTFHGLRRSFKTLTEWIEAPRGVVHQIQGHKPSATAEKHYTKRPIDMLRLWHTKIEAWFLEQAGVEFEPMEEENPAALKLVQGGTK